MHCYICHGSNLTKFLDLGHHPPSDNFRTAEDLQKSEASYPLTVYLCRDCFLVQLGYAADPEELFRGFVYTSGSNNSLVANFHQLVESAVARFAIGTNDLAIDIGSNDGTLLKNYLPHGVKVLGIDPASVVAKLAEEQGIPTLVDFFNPVVAARIRTARGQAKIITATNVFAHVRDLDDLMRAIGETLAPDGVFISESHYLLDLVTKLQYDSIYLEHLRYYSLRPLQRLFERFGMELFDAERVPTHGGSIRVYATKHGSYPVAERVWELIAAEESAGLYRAETFDQFDEHVRQNKLALYTMVAGLKKEGVRIVGIGAPAKGNTLLNYCRFDPDIIAYLVEKNPLKIGRFAPGTHIPIVDESKLFSDQPEYALLLSWNIADELIPKIRTNGFRGKFIVPNPAPMIV